MIFIVKNEYGIGVFNEPFHPKYGYIINDVVPTKEQLEEIGFFVDYKPKAEDNGMCHEDIILEGTPRKISDDPEQAKLDLEFNRSLLGYRYFEREKSPQEIMEERLNQLELENAQLLKDEAKKDLDISLLQQDNAQKDLVISQLQADVAEILKNMAKPEGGV